jgi:CheY-like chemotaxis protein
MNDAAELLETMRFVLQDAGYRVTIIAEALSYVRKLAEYRPDLIILDWLFHGQSRGGLEVVQAIRLTPEIKDLPLIVCTAAIREVREMAVYLQLQGVTVLYKPFDSTVFSWRWHGRWTRAGPSTTPKTECGWPPIPRIDCPTTEKGSDTGSMRSLRRCSAYGPYTPRHEMPETGGSHS